MLSRLTLKLALRNLARHRGRSAIMLAALALFVGVCIALEGIASGFYGSMTEVAVGHTLGELQVHAPGHLPARDPAAILAEGEALAAEIEALEEVRVAVGRARAPAMVSHQSEARGVDLIGVGPGELEFGPIPERVVEGRFISGEAGERGEVVVGQGLARSLSVDLGETLELRVGLGAGPGEGQRFTVVGVFASGNRQADASLVYVPLADARELLGLGEGELSEIAIRVEGSADPESVAERVRELCPAARAEPDGGSDRCEVAPWSELQPALAASMTTDHNFLRATFAVLVLVAGIMVLNLQLMSVLERTRELGMMMAIGASPRRLFWMLVSEAFTLGIIGVGAGVAGGVAVVASLSGGIDVAALAGGETEIGGFAFTPRVVPELRPEVALGMALGALVVTVAAAVVPALHLFRMNPLAALQGRARASRDKGAGAGT